MRLGVGRIANHDATLGFNPGKVWKGKNQWYQLFTFYHSSDSPLHPILSTPSSVVGNQQTLSVISTGPMFFLSKWPVSTQSPSLSFQAETFPPQSEKHVLQNGGFRNTSVTCTAQIETQRPKQSRASRTMGLCPASTKYLAQDRPRGDQWNQQGNKRNSSSIKVFCGLAFVWTPSSKIQVQYEGFLQIGRGFLDNLWIKHQTLWKKTCLKPPPTWLHIYLNIFQPCPDIKIFSRLKGLHQWWPPEVQTCQSKKKYPWSLWKRVLQIKDL